MKKLIIFSAILCLFSCNKHQSLISSKDDFDYQHWPKNGTIRRGVELPVSPFLNYKLELKPGFSDSALYFALPLFDADTLKQGRFEISIYGTIENAQLALADFLNAMQSPFKPSQLTHEEAPFGDIAFGEERETIFFVLFTRDNVRVIIKAPTVLAKELGQKIDSIILNSPVWAPGDSKPVFIITEEFLQAFFVESP